MNASEQKRVYGPFKRFDDNGLHIDLLGVFDEVFHQLLVVVHEE
jgi:hypothetical protein